VVYKILVVEDQKEISEIVEKYLLKEGYDVFVAYNGFEALEIFGKSQIHLVLLDIMMPGINGIQVLEEIRKISDVPVIMMTAKGEEMDRIAGFENGADDYVVKPFSARELVKRVQVFIKRIYNESEEIILKYNNLKLYTKSMKLFKDNIEIDITAAEFKVLYVFFKNPGIVLSRESLIELAFGVGYEGYDRNIDGFIKKIRQKIEKDPRNPEFLITKYGAGYIFGGG